MKRLLALAVFATAGIMTQTASATVIGTLNLANCNGGGVAVTNNSISWTPAATAPAQAGFGCISTGAGTTVTYGSGTALGVGTIGDIQNLVLSPPSGGAQFITFIPGNLDFVLTGLSLPSTPTVAGNCATITAGQTCTDFVGSPFLLTNNGGITQAATVATGTITDGGVMSLWTGEFTTQIVGTVASVAATLNGGGTITSTISDSFNVTVIPEPGTIAMMLFGGAMLAFAKKRSSKA